MIILKTYQKLFYYFNPSHHNMSIQVLTGVVLGMLFFSEILLASSYEIIPVESFSEPAFY